MIIVIRIMIMTSLKGAIVDMQYPHCAANRLHDVDLPAQTAHTPSEQM